MKQLSHTVAGIPASAATAVNYRVQERLDQGADVVSFCVGQPDFPTADAPAAAGIRAIRAGETYYTPPAGTVALRAAVAGAMARDFGLSYTAREVAVTTGGKYAVFAAVAALCDAGDEFVIPTPCWPSYAPITRLCGGRAVFVPCAAQNGFKLTPAALRGACTERTKALLLNNPCNPTGALYSRAELAALLDVCREEDVYVISDEVYARLIYDDLAFTPAASLGADARARTITVGSASKTYAMPGWRIGWVCAEKDIIDKITIYVNHTTGNPCSISQAAALEALRGDQTYTGRMAARYQARRDVLIPALREMGLPCALPEGAFYALADIRDTGWESARAFAAALLERENVAVVPCEDYGAPGYIRLAYTLPEARLREGLARLARFVKEERV